MARGGKRTGSGRRKNSEPTVTVRVPVSMKKTIKQFVKNNKIMNNFMLIEAEKEPSFKEGLSNSVFLLKSALKLKANAGGKIKTEIRKALDYLQSV